MSNNILLFWELEGRWRPVLQKSFGVSRYHNIMDMVIFHYFDRATMNLQITKKRIHLVSCCQSTGIMQTKREGTDRIPLWRWLGRLNQNGYHICEQKAYFGHWRQVLVWHPLLDEPTQQPQEQMRDASWTSCHSLQHRISSQTDRWISCSKAIHQGLPALLNHAIICSCSY